MPKAPEGDVLKFARRSRTKMSKMRNEVEGRRVKGNTRRRKLRESGAPGSATQKK